MKTEIRFNGAAAAQVVSDAGSFDDISPALEAFAESPSLEARKRFLEMAREVMGHSITYAHLCTVTLDIIDRSSVPDEQSRSK